MINIAIPSADTNIAGMVMKIVHTSDIHLGKKFTGFNLAGDKLRAGLKSTFSKIIDLAISEKADLFIVAGNLFHSLDISNNLQDFIATELGRLESIQAVVMPGIQDKYTDGSFWKTWQSARDYKNVYLFTDLQKPYIVLKNLDCTVYGMFDKQNGAAIGGIARQQTNTHIGIMCSTLDAAKVRVENSGVDFDYVALGGEQSFKDLSPAGLMAAYSGSPENLNFDAGNQGKVAVVEIGEQKNIKINAVQVGSFIWKIEEIKAKEIITNDDLIAKLQAMAGDDPSKTALRVKLTGLALFESDLNPAKVQEQLHGEFLCLDIIDNMKVLPENVSAVKVSEKTLLGQYIKVMADEISKADESQKSRLEQSAKVGLALLQGREIW